MKLIYKGKEIIVKGISEFYIWGEYQLTDRNWAMCQIPRWKN